ncbi:MAG: hypothetical protein Q4D39_00805 [Coriobacteriaceae bacterium]|nr:hypothetical protein [Coriobacteriaceae bacterium]
MSVEVAVIIPVVVVVALTIANIMAFLGCCAAFDRASLDAVIAHGISPAGVQSELSATSAIRSSIEEAFGSNPAVSVEVSAERLSSSSGFLASLCPHLVRYTCTLHFRPWPQHLRLAGTSMDAPFEVIHERSLVVDRFRPGVVI